MIRSAAACLAALALYAVAPAIAREVADDRLGPRPVLSTQSGRLVRHVTPGGRIYKVRLASSGGSIGDRGLTLRLVADGPAPSRRG